MEVENTFFNHFYNSVEILKSHYKKFIPIMVFYFCVLLCEIFYSQATDDVTRIVSALGLGLIGVFISVYLINIFNFLLSTSTSTFSLRKVFWDLPTYLYYELGFGILLLFSTLLLVIPGLYVGFFYAHVPVVSVCFDEYDKGEGIFSLTKRAVSLNKTLNFLLLILSVLTSFLFLGIERLYVMTGLNLGLSAALILVYIHIVLVQYGIMISYLKTSIELTKSDETQTDLL